MSLAKTLVSVPPMVSAFSAEWGFIHEGIAATSPVSAAFETANRGVWYPVLVPTPCMAKRCWWVNGATVDVGNNIEAGIYASAGYKPGAKLITTGSVAQGTANQVQFADITDTLLMPGRYWLFLSCSTVSATFFRSLLSSANYDELFKFHQASIGPGSAPATATPVECDDNNVYLTGFSTTTTT